MLLASTSSDHTWSFGPGRQPPRSVGDGRGTAGNTLPSRPIVLVVDDDAANLLLARALLEAEGFDVRTATDAISTFDALKESDPGIILMDIQLPGMDGWELTRRLKANTATAHIPIVGMTAYALQGDDERARASGFVDFVARPVSTRDLPAIVRRHLRG